MAIPLRSGERDFFFPTVKLHHFMAFLRGSGSKIVLFDEMGCPLQPVWARLGPAGTKMSPLGGKILHSVRGVRRI